MNNNIFFVFKGIELSKYLKGIDKFFGIQNIDIKVGSNLLTIYAYNGFSSIQINFEIECKNDKTFYFNINNKVLNSFIFNKEEVKAVFENNTLKLSSNKSKATIECNPFNQESLNIDYDTLYSLSNEVKDFLFSSLKYVIFSGKLFKPDDTFIKFRIKDNIVRLLFIEFFCSAELKYKLKNAEKDSYFSLPVSMYNIISYFFINGENISVLIDDNAVIFKDKECSIRLSKVADKHNEDIFDIYDEDIKNEKSNECLGKFIINSEDFLKEDLKDLDSFNSSAFINNKITLIKVADKESLICEVINAFGKSQRLIDKNIKMCEINDKLDYSFNFNCNFDAFKIAISNIKDNRSQIVIYKNRLYILTKINDKYIQYQLVEVND